MSLQTSGAELASTGSWSGSDGICSLNPDRVGRDGFLHLAFERQGSRTVLTERRFTLPLQALEPIPLDSEGAAVLLLLNPTGGLVGGDRLSTDVTVSSGAHCCLTTPAATKVYRTVGPPALQSFSARLAPGSILEYVPDHLIPFPGAAFRQSIHLELEEKSVAIIYDAFAIGRVARGEGWDFSEIENLLTVTDLHGVRLRDRFMLTPSRRAWSGVGGMEEMNYLATLGILFEEDPSALLSELETALAGEPRVKGGVSRLGRGGLLVRFLAETAPDLQGMFHQLWTLTRRAVLGLGPLDLRKL